MKILLRFAAAGVLGLLALMAGSARAQISESGPYYATPSWDQQLPAGSRWVILTNWASAAVLDRETGLVWQTTPMDQFGRQWLQAFSDCRGARTGGRLGWRLPSQEELNSLAVVNGGGGIDLPPGTPFVGTEGNSYWTATTLESDNTRAYIVIFDAVNTISPVYDAKLDLQGVWCVRGSQGAQNPQ